MGNINIKGYQTSIKVKHETTNILKMENDLYEVSLRRYDSSPINKRTNPMDNSFASATLRPPVLDGTNYSLWKMMRMEESENILEYDRRLREIANEAFSVGEAISNERLVSKVLRSLPERFNIKICAIDEAKDTSKMALEDLISSLRTFEMNLDMKKKDKGKTIALQASNDSYNELLQISQEVNDSDLCEDSISFITKKFGDYLKRIRDKKKDAQPSKFPSLPAPEKSQKYPAKQQLHPRNEGKGQYNSKRYDSVQCRECKGFGHYANECANRLRKNKGYNVSLSDEESDAEEKSTDEESQTSLTALFTENRWLQVNPLGVALEADYEELTLESVQKLYEELFEDWTKRNKLNSSLMKENVELKAVVAKLEVILSKKDLELGKTKEELQKGKADTSPQPQSNSPIKSSSSKRQPAAPIAKKRKRRDDRKNQKLSRMLPRMLSNTFCNTFHHRPTVRQIWVSKVKTHCKVVYTSLETNTAGHWYFDNGSSRHMIGSRECLTDYVEQKGGKVTYEGGAKGKIVGKGTRSSDNCYQISEELSCKHVQITELDLWHQKLGHANFKTLKNLSKYDAVRGMPNLSSGISYVCGDCQKGKQTRVSHPVLPTSGTTCCLELLHMDLMGPMEVESIGGKAFHTNFQHQKPHSKMALPNARTGLCKKWQGDQLAKFDSKSDKCLFLGYATNSRAYRMFNLRTRTIMESINVVFDDCADLKRKTAKDDVEDLLENPISLENADVAPDVATSGTTCDAEDTESEEPHCNDDTVDDGSSLKDEFWINAMHDELEQFVRNDVWDLVPPPDHARIESVRLLLAVACYMKIKPFQMDVKSTFLNGILSEEVYVRHPKGFEDPHNLDHVYKSKKALYGLKQAPRAWYGRLTEYLLEIGFKRGEVDKTLFIQKSKGEILICQVYVDDIIFGSSSQKHADDFVECMSSIFEMSIVGELNFFLGLQIKQMRDDIFLCQSKYAKNLIKKFANENPKHMKTPIGSSEKLCKEDVAENVDNTLYRSIIGSLLYLTASRPDIMFSVCLCARYQSNPKISHLKAVKRILRYIAGTIELGLWYTHETNSNLVGFSDADWAGDLDDRKSTSGGCFYLGNNLISWHSRKQNCVSLSTAELEYVAVGNACTQLLWMNQMIEDYGLKSESLVVYCDNSSAINISKNPSQKDLKCGHLTLTNMTSKRSKIEKSSDGSVIRRKDGKSYLKEPNEGCAFSELWVLTGDVANICDNTSSASISHA
ncbi:uncharacterized protein LOC142537565 [Primulina tabacum]|uniref:uncharacterized protein LOC142537565 n=1 Tax=Primulina tabacum TaxID=48773 RepID=UPI003F5AAAF9